MDSRHSGDIHCLLQHDDSKWDARNPADEADDGKDGEKGKDNASTPKAAVQIVDCCSNCKYAIQYPGNPHELFGEGSSGEEISPGKGECDTDDESEEDDCVGVEGEVVGGIVDAAAVEAMISRVAVERQSADCDKA